jgi:polyhydroxybutyrate depolymerase
MGGADGLEYRTLDVAGVRRGYWVARALGGNGAARAGVEQPDGEQPDGEQPDGEQPDGEQSGGGLGAGTLLVVLHGSGTSGKDVATFFSGLASRGPEAGMSVVFPDGWDEVWHIARAPAGEPRLDDAAFLRDLVRLLGATSVVLAGISNGAGFAEHMVRHGLLRVAGLFLVAGTFREFSRQAQPIPLQRTPVTIMSGTGDRAVNYYGGPLRAPGILGLILRRRAARAGDLPSERRVAPVEEVARDWAAGNGIGREPVAERLPDAPGDPPATRLTWSAPGCPPVVLYRIEGGGHGWPGGPQYLPARIIGPVPRHLDATGILLEMVASVSDAGPVASA